LSSPHPIVLFWHRYLAGRARWESRLRAGGTAGFCFVRPLTATLRVCGSPKKQNELRSFLAPPQKGSPWHLRAGPSGKAYGLDMTDEMLALAHA